MLDTPLRDRGLASWFRPYLSPGAAALATLPATGCRWPLGPVESADFRFCAEPRERGSYCALHARQARR